MRTPIAFSILVVVLMLAAILPPHVLAEKGTYMAEVVDTLASPAMDGRETGTSGHFLAANFVASELQKLGLYPLGSLQVGDETSDYFHLFPLTSGSIEEDAVEVAGRNIVAWLPGSESADPADGCFILSAHYDHTGAYTDENAERHYFPGANDNASGVAVVLEVARRCAVPGRRPRNPVVFVLFDAEEQGLIGACDFVENPPVPLDNALIINLDMVGALGKRELLVACSAEQANTHPGTFFAQLKDIAANVDLDIKLMREGWEASDQLAFYEKHVPFIFLFGGPTADYERLTDTPDKLDYAGLERITDFTWRLLHDLASPASYEWVDLGERERPQGARRGFLGVIPDFSAEVDEGVAITGTVPGSPAEKAGLLEDDVIIEIDRRPVHNLQALADILRDLKPGDIVEVVYLRDGVEQRITARIAEKGEEEA